MANTTKEEKKETIEQQTRPQANLADLESHLRRFDHIFHLFVMFLDKEAEFKKFIIDYQEKQKKAQEAADTIIEEKKEGK